jgi:hypothetical protein
MVQGRRADMEKRLKARGLREQGWTNARIAKLMGISEQAVSRLANSLGPVKAPEPNHFLVVGFSLQRQSAD